MAFSGIKDVVDAEVNGKMRSYQWRKLPSAATTAGIWFDLATTSGNPKQKNWFDAAPLTATQVKQSTDGGIFHGANVSTAQKILRKTTHLSNSATPLPMAMMLCDYLLYYPTIDDSELAQQDLDNTLTLPRYTSGVGVQVMAITLAARTGSQQFFFTYTNSDGVSGRISQTVTMNTSAVIGSITTSHLTPSAGCSAPFIGLQAGDSGVRSIESVQMLGADTGLFALVLVKPLGETQIRGIDAPVETDYLIHRGEITPIQDDAYLNYLCLPNGSLSGVTLMGTLKTVWN